MTTVLSCPHCNASIGTDPNLAGQIVQCPQCRQALTMPALAVARAVPPVLSAVAPPTLPVESSLPVVGPSRGGNRYRKPSGVPVWAWIVGGFGGMVLLCCGGPLLLMPSAEQMEQSTKRAKQREHKRFVKEAMSSKPSTRDRYSRRELDEAKAELRKRGMHDADDNAARAVKDLETIMKSERGGR